MPARLKTRAAFKAAAAGARAHAHLPAQSRSADQQRSRAQTSKRGKTARREPPKDQLFTLQANHAPDANDTARVGFTVTKKVGNAVVRNRIKRRLRAVTDKRADAFQRGTHYVVLARPAALHAPHDVLCQSLDRAVHVVHERLIEREATPAPSGPPSADRQNVVRKA